MSDVSDKIAADALKTQSTTNDGVSITRRSLKDQIEADRYLRDIAATDPENAGLGFRINQVVANGGPS